MKNKITVAAAVLVSFVAGMSVAAFQPDNSYHQAAEAVQGEWAAMRVNAGVDREAVKRAKARADHWISIMEQFKP